MQRYTFNVYKIPAKEHQGANRQDAEEISVSQILFWKYLEYVPLILNSYKKLNNSKIVGFKSSSFFKSPILLSDSSTIIFKKRMKCPHNITFLYKLLYKGQNVYP